MVLFSLARISTIRTKFINKRQLRTKRNPIERCHTHAQTFSFSSFGCVPRASERCLYDSQCAVHKLGLNVGNSKKINILLRPICTTFWIRNKIVGFQRFTHTWSWWESWESWKIRAMPDDYFHKWPRVFTDWVRR